jgi:hypothetical protein
LKVEKENRELLSKLFVLLVSGHRLVLFSLTADALVVIIIKREPLAFVKGGKRD